jgi:hypothetical protein
MAERNTFGAEIARLDIVKEREKELSEYEMEGAVPVRKIILVAGVEYPRYKKKPEDVRGKRGKWWVLAGKRTIPARSKDGSHWRTKCMAIAKSKLQKDPGWQIYLYDFDRAIEERMRLDGTKLTTETIRKLAPMHDEDYRWVDKGVLRPISQEPLSLNDHPTRPYIRYCPLVSTIDKDEVAQSVWLEKITQQLKAKKLKKSEIGPGILDVYSHIEFIGKHKPYTLHELHLFGHASSAHYPHSGTAFLNTNHLSRDHSKRDSLDLDARADLDFLPSTIDQKLFRMAFAKGAMSYVWGCNWHRPIYDMVRQAQSALGSKALTDQSEFQFKWRGEGVSGEKDDFQAISSLASCGAWNNKKNVLEMDGKCLRTILTQLLRNSYMQQLANASSHCVTGGLPGTYSDYDNKTERGNLRLSHIPMGGLYGTTHNLTPVMEFFEKQLGITFNKQGAHRKFGRGFALYCPSV